MLRRLAALALCAGLLVSGCSSHQKQPQTLPPLPPSHSPSTSPTPSPTTSPPNDSAAIVALVRAYYDARNTVVRSGDSARLRALSTATCPCLAFANEVERTWRNGSIEATDYYRILRVDQPQFRSGTVGLVSLTYRTTGYTVLDRSGKTVKVYPPDDRPESSMLELHKFANTWRVADVARL